MYPPGAAGTCCEVGGDLKESRLPGCGIMYLYWGCQIRGDAGRGTCSGAAVLPTEQWVSIMQFMPRCYDDYSQNSLFGLFDNATLLEIVEHFEHGQID